jgi:hypothetical protein
MIGALGWLLARKLDGTDEVLKELSLAVTNLTETINEYRVEMIEHYIDQEQLQKELDFRFEVCELRNHSKEKKGAA